MNFAGVILLIAAFGLMSTGSLWCIPILIISLWALWLSDSASWDAEVLGGFLVIIMLTGVTYTALRTTWLFFA